MNTPPGDLSARLARISRGFHAALDKARSEDDVNDALITAVNTANDIAATSEPDIAACLDSWADKMEASDFPNLPETGTDTAVSLPEHMLADWREEVRECLAVINENPIPAKRARARNRPPCPAAETQTGVSPQAILSDQIRKAWSMTLDQVEHHDDHVIVYRYKDPAAVLVPHSWYRSARALQAAVSMLAKDADGKWLARDTTLTVGELLTAAADAAMSPLDEDACGACSHRAHPGRDCASCVSAGLGPCQDAGTRGRNRNG